MNRCEEVITRSISPEDHATVRAITKRSFSVMVRGMVRFGPNDLVAILGGRVVGAVLLHVMERPREGKIGRVALLVTDPEHRGRGIARQLVRQGVDRLHALGCGQIVAEVEGYNTPSANIFHELGFRRLGSMAQIRWLGAVGAVVIGVRTFRLFTPGHFLWARGVPGRPASPEWQRAGTWALNVFIALLAVLVGGGLLLAGGPEIPSLSAVLAVVVAVVLLLGLREAAMWAIGRAQGVTLEYRGWGSGVGASLVIAILFGSVFPLPGGCYPPGDGWHYRQFQRQLAIAAAGATGTVALLLVAAFGARLWGATGFTADVARSLLDVGMALLLFDSIIAMGPFQGYSARRMLDHNRKLWLAFAIVGIAFYLLAVSTG